MTQANPPTWPRADEDDRPIGPLLACLITIGATAVVLPLVALVLGAIALLAWIGGNW
jgi:hypothetical protein